MTNTPRVEVPWETYLTAWRLFRSVSNEDTRTAEHLTTCPAWSWSDDLVLLDIGSGDGRLVERVLGASATTPVREVRLLEPDPHLLEEATARIEEAALAPLVRPILGTVEDCFAQSAVGAGVVLAVHVVYLLSDGTLQQMIDALPVGVPLYVVLDSPSSVFTSLWRRTAPRYHARACAAHALLRSLSSGFCVTCGAFTSEIRSPYSFADARGIRLLSFLSYTNLAEADRDLQAWVKTTIAEHTHDGFVRCESTCYEVVRL